MKPQFSPADFWAPWEEKISSYKALVTAIDKVMDKAKNSCGRFAWRGQSHAEWALHSSLFRNVYSTNGATVPQEADVRAYERSILNELHRWGLHNRRESGRLSILAQLAMLQHYGAPTRLIDVSFNAWIGVWFAVEKTNSDLDDKDGRLFAVDVSNRLISENDRHRYWEDVTRAPWRTNKKGGLSQAEWSTSVFAWKPGGIDARISAQNGGFLFGGVPATRKPNGGRFQFPKSPDNGAGRWSIEDGRRACCLALRPHKLSAARGSVRSGAVFTFRIKQKAKAEIRERIESMFGYAPSSIYPDFMGFAKYGVSSVLGQSI